MQEETISSFAVKKRGVKLQKKFTQSHYRVKYIRQQDLKIFTQGGKPTCSSRCARRSRLENRGMPSGENSASGRESGNVLSDLPPWQPLKRLDMRRGAFDLGPTWFYLQLKYIDVSILPVRQTANSGGTVHILGEFYSGNGESIGAVGVGELHIPGVRMLILAQTTRERDQFQESKTANT